MKTRHGPVLHSQAALSLGGSVQVSVTVLAVWPQPHWKTQAHDRTRHTLYSTTVAIWSLLSETEIKAKRRGKGDRKRQKCWVREEQNGGEKMSKRKRERERVKVDGVWEIKREIEYVRDGVKERESETKCHPRTPTGLPAEERVPRHVDPSLSEAQLEVLSVSIIDSPCLRTGPGQPKHPTGSGICPQTFTRTQTHDWIRETVLPSAYNCSLSL